MPAFVYWAARAASTTVLPILRRIFSVSTRGGRLLDQLLVPPLHGALTLAEVHDAPMVVGEHLELDVARGLEILLEVDVTHAEGRLGLALRRSERRRQIARAADDAHAAPAAAGRRLDDDGIARGPGRS